MKYTVFLLAALAACYANPRYRTYPRTAPVPPRESDVPPRPVEPVRPEPKYPPPESYTAGVKQLDTLKIRIDELSAKDRLFEVPPLARHVSFVASTLPELIEKDCVDRIISEIAAAGDLLKTISELLEKRAIQEGKDKVRELNAEILPQLEVLKKYENLSDEYEVQKVPRNCPATYQRALIRISGVYHAIQEKLQADLLFEVSDIAKHLKVVAENMRRLALNDIAFPIRNQVKNACDTIRDAAERLQYGAEREDKEKVSRELEGLAEPIKSLDGTWRFVTGKSALEALPEREK